MYCMLLDLHKAVIIFIHFDPFLPSLLDHIYSCSLFYCQQTHLLNPSLIELALRFYIATASWLNQVALAGDNFDKMTCFKEVEIPLPTEVCFRHLGLELSHV